MLHSPERDPVVPMTCLMTCRQSFRQLVPPNQKLDEQNGKSTKPQTKSTQISLRSTLCHCCLSITLRKVWFPQRFPSDKHFIQHYNMVHPIWLLVHMLWIFVHSTHSTSIPPSLSILRSSALSKINQRMSRSRAPPLLSFSCPLPASRLLPPLLDCTNPLLNYNVYDCVLIYVKLLICYIITGDNTVYYHCLCAQQRMETKAVSWQLLSMHNYFMCFTIRDIRQHTIYVLLQGWMTLLLVSCQGMQAFAPALLQQLISKSRCVSWSRARAKTCIFSRSPGGVLVTSGLYVTCYPTNLSYHLMK